MLPTDVKCCLFAETAEDCYILLKKTKLAIQCSLIFIYFLEIWEKASLAQHKKLQSLLAMLTSATRGSCM